MPAPNVKTPPSWTVNTTRQNWHDNLQHQLILASTIQFVKQLIINPEHGIYQHRAWILQRVDTWIKTHHRQSYGVVCTSSDVGYSLRSYGSQKRRIMPICFVVDSQLTELVPPEREDSSCAAKREGVWQEYRTKENEKYRTIRRLRQRR
jgi:hypothetical protein